MLNNLNLYTPRSNKYLQLQFSSINIINYNKIIIRAGSYRLDENFDCNEETDTTCYHYK